MTNKKQVNTKWYIITSFFIAAITVSSFMSFDGIPDLKPRLISTGYALQAGSVPPDSIYTKVDIEATYPGGEPNWGRYLQKNLRYPEKAQDNMISGDVVVQFVVDTSGKVSDVKAISGHKELQDESIRVIQQSGIWLPAVAHGKKVASYAKKTIKFRID